jgi:hypothetical protein
MVIDSMGFKQMLMQKVCPHSEVSVQKVTENDEALIIHSKCLICGKELNQYSIDKVGGMVTEIQHF